MELLKIIFSTWQFNLTMALLSTVLFTQFYKLAVKGTPSDGISAIILEFIAGLGILVFVPLFPFSLASDMRVYLLFLLAAVFYAINDRMQATVRKNLDVSVCVIINQLHKVFLVLYGILIFSEGMVASKLIGGGRNSARKYFLVLS